MGVFGLLVNRVTLLQYGDILPLMTLSRGHKPDAAM